MNFIHVYENVLPQPTCDALANAVDEAAIDRQDSVAARLPQLRHPFLQGRHVALRRSASSYFTTSFRKYIDEAGGRVLNFCSLLEEPNIVRYAPESVDHFDEHADSWSSGKRHQTGQRHPLLERRDKGGETVFPRFNMWVKPRRGSVLLFPSAFTHMHRGDPPRSEPKRCIVTWIHMGTPQSNNAYYKTVALKP